MKIAVDVKNLALYAGGISAFFRPLLKNWINAQPQLDFILIGPSFDDSEFCEFNNVQSFIVDWPRCLPRFLRHPYYDNWLFPRAISLINPDFVFTPYHDVRLPRNVPSVMMIHDTCIGDLPGIYPFKVRSYYQHMLKLNMLRCAHILTVSETSKQCLISQYSLSDSQIDVIPNSFEATVDVKTIVQARQSRKKLGIQLFYAGGTDHRKNVRRLVQAVEVIANRGINISLQVTGSAEEGWSRELLGLSTQAISRVEFLGRLDLQELNLRYAAADAVVYPTLCEGFGRVCLEAMSVGTPLACSDLPVLREVAGEYPVYFDSYDVLSIADGIMKAVNSGYHEPYLDEKFSRNTVSELFVATLDKILARELPLYV